MLKIYFFERERESRLLPKEGGGRERESENPKQTPCWAWSPLQGLDPMT